MHQWLWIVVEDRYNLLTALKLILGTCFKQGRSTSSGSVTGDNI